MLDDIADGVGDGGMESYLLDLHAGEVHPNGLSGLERSFHREPLVLPLLILAPAAAFVHLVAGVALRIAGQTENQPSAIALDLVNQRPKRASFTSDRPCVARAGRHRSYGRVAARPTHVVPRLYASEPLSDIRKKRDELENHP